MLNHNGSDLKCSICCPNCKKFVTLSPYFTLTGIGFRVQNFARHFATYHSAPLTNLNPMQCGIIKKKLNQSTRPALKRLSVMHKRTAVAISSTLNNSLLDTSSPSTSLDNTQMSSITATLPVPVTYTDPMINQKVVELYNSHQQLKNECDELRNMAASLKIDIENEKKQIERKMMDKIVQDLERVSLQQRTDGDAENWQQKFEAIEYELFQTKAQLREFQLERRNLLHELLDLKGRVRVMARLRPLYQSSEQMMFEITDCQKILKSKKNVFVYSPIFLNLIIIIFNF